MKQVKCIVLVILFLLPSIGVHLDLTHCCGGLQSVGLSHEINVDITDCCDMEKDASCMESTEIAQPPTYQNLSTSQQLEPPITFFVYVKSAVKATAPRLPNYSTHNNDYSSEVEAPPLSLFQVFLC